MFAFCLILWHCDIRVDTCSLPEVPDKMSAASKLPTPGSGNERFNNEAMFWDSNPFVQTASKHACEALLKRFPALSKENPSLDILEIGCGTGLLTFLMAPYARSITAVDASHGMIDVLKQKIEKGGVGNVEGVCVLLEDPEDEALPPSQEDEALPPSQEADPQAVAKGEKAGRMKFDLITSHLVLHHIPDLDGLLKTLLGFLKKNGSIAVTDFEFEGAQSRCFHPKSKMDGVERDGIGREEMEVLMREVGYIDVKVEVGWSMEKRVERWEGEFGNNGKGDEDEGMIRQFPFVVCMGRR
jgi:2-polyprenyl-3-methyl-5-hydroxy-6-metoxy-1,4-benzoquinol methylase